MSQQNQNPHSLYQNSLSSIIVMLNRINPADPRTNQKSLRSHLKTVLDHLDSNCAECAKAMGEWKSSKAERLVVKLYHDKSPCLPRICTETTIVQLEELVTRYGLLISAAQQPTTSPDPIVERGSTGEA